MIQKFCQIGTVMIAALVLAGSAGQVLAQAERFEITSIKAVRPTLVDTIAALQAGDVARAKAAFEAYDSAWNGIEVYVNVRSKAMYQTLEHEYQARIAKALEAPIRTPRRCSRTRRRCPVNSLFDDVARLRIVRARICAKCRLL